MVWATRTFFLPARPQVKRGRNQNQGQEGQDEVEECATALIVLELLASHRGCGRLLYGNWITIVYTTARILFICCQRVGFRGALFGKPLSHTLHKYPGCADVLSQNSKGDGLEQH